MAGGLLLLGACASKPLTSYSEAMPPAVLVTLDDAAVKDLRGRFRAAVCPRLAAGTTSCDDMLLRFPGEVAATSTPPRAVPVQRYHIVFVPGLFTECLGALRRPFADTMDVLRRRGFDVHYFQVAGRGTVAANAEQLSRSFAGLSDDGRQVIVFAYSKGLPDVLEFVVRYPEAARRVAAIVGVAGAANGSPLAEDMDSLYRSLGARFPLPACDPGTGDEIRDLRRETRLEWWRRYGSAIGVPVFSLVAVPRPGHISPVLSAKHARLAEMDPRNDGQLLWYDAIAARGSLLGYVNADHWTIAIAFQMQLPGLAGLFHDDVPRTALVEAAIEVVDETLAASGRR